MHDLLIKGGTIVDGTGAAAFTGDIAVDDGMIAEVGHLGGVARQVVAADGALVTPGWIDGHTHYDGQVTWDDRMEGSASNGVTTVVMGNCGVGFAPVRPHDQTALVELMEGVESIPGTALHEGIPWGAWESFEEYIDFLDAQRWSLDVGAQVPHGALRHYVMGERSVEDYDAGAEEASQMAALAERAMRAGAVGFSTSRVQFHRSMSGRCVPGTFAPEEELAAICDGLSAGGGGVFQTIASSTGGERPGYPPEQASLRDEVRMLSRFSRGKGLSVNFTLAQNIEKPWEFRDILKLVAEENGLGARLRPMVAARAITSLTSLRTYHMFTLRPTFRSLLPLPFGQLVAELRRPEVKAAILAEPDVRIEPAGAMENAMPFLFRNRLDLIFPLVEPLDYEPPPNQSLAARAAAEGRDKYEYYYDFLLGDDGDAVAAYMGANYSDGDLGVCREMIQDPYTVFGLSDAGAHVNFLCDASMPTFQLLHWARDRSRGELLPVELVVHKATAAVANLYSFSDRGTITAGKRADLNVIDFDALAMTRPQLHHDLPAGGARFLQPARGYVATFVRGVQTRSGDEDTGARPGRVARAHPQRPDTTTGGSVQR